MMHKRSLSPLESRIYGDFCEGLTIREIEAKRHLRYEEIEDIRYRILAKGHKLPFLKKIIPNF